VTGISYFRPFDGRIWFLRSASVTGPSALRPDVFACLTSGRKGFNCREYDTESEALEDLARAWASSQAARKSRRRSDR